MEEKREAQSKESQGPQEVQQHEQEEQLGQPELDQTGPSNHPTAQQRGEWRSFDEREQES